MSLIYLIYLKYLLRYRNMLYKVILAIELFWIKYIIQVK